MQKPALIMFNGVKLNLFLHCIVTDDEKWILYIKLRSAQWLDIDKKPEHQLKLLLSLESYSEHLVKQEQLDIP